MGVDDMVRGQGYGTTLLLHAFATAFETLSIVGHVGMLVDPNNDQLMSYYAKHGFMPLGGGRRMFASVEQMRAICQAEGLDLSIPMMRLSRSEVFEKMLEGQE